MAMGSVVIMNTKYTDAGRRRKEKGGGKRRREKGRREEREFGITPVIQERLQWQSEYVQ
jgi:hypothetical protein